MFLDRLRALLDLAAFEEPQTSPDATASITHSA